MWRISLCSFATRTRVRRGEDRYLERLTELRVGGVLITALDYENHHLSKLRRLGIPVVLVDRAPDSAAEWCSVGVDDIAGGEMATNHLLEIGHRQLCFVGGPGTIPQVADRHTGAQKAVAVAGLGDDALLHLETSAPTIAEGRHAGERLLGLPKRDRPSGVFCANDLLAFGLVQYLLQHGVDVPQEIAIVGYDDIELAAAASVPLTSVAQPRRLLGRTGAELLLDEARGDDHEHRHVLFLPELVARASTLTQTTSA